MPPLTTLEKNTPAGMSTIDGGVASGYNPLLTTPRPSAPAAPTPAAAPTVTPEPTVGETLTGIKTEALRIQDILNQRAKSSPTAPTYDTYPTYEELYPEIDEKEVARRQRKLFQAEIDATNRVYDDMLAQERLAGQGRLGTGRAIAARGGLLGSDFGEAQRQNIQGANMQAENAVQNERMAKIGTILGTMRKAVADEITEKRAARQQGAENYISYLASARERKEANRNLAARAILDSGLDITDMDQAEIEAIGKEAGLSAQEIIMAYTDLKKTQDAAAAEADLNTRKTESEIAKNKRIELSEGQTLLDENGNVIYKAPKTYAPTTGGGLGQFSSASVSEAASTLDQSRGADNFANTALYLDLYQQAVENEVLPQDFFKKFPPDLYLNPDDETVPGYIKQQMQEIDLFGRL